MSEELQKELLVSIHQFLLKSNLNKSAKSLCKETGLDDSIASQFDPFDLMTTYQVYHKKRLKRSVQNSSVKRSKLSLDTPSGNSEHHCPLTQIGKATTDNLPSSDSCLVQVTDHLPVPLLKENHRKFFKRVTTSLDQIDPLLRDNSYEFIHSRDQHDKSWGVKANSDFKNTSGKSFRHEKTKKKRGSYKGGKIDPSIGSIKFQYSDDSNSD